MFVSRKSFTYISMTMKSSTYDLANLHISLSDLLLTFADGKWLHPEQLLPGELCSAQWEWSSAP